ncbi:MAG: hypothetical protein ABSA66_15600 [Roseiarcus sp.]
MKVWLAFAALLFATPCLADECDVVTARIVQATGATFDRRSEIGNVVFKGVEYPLTMNCGKWQEAETFAEVKFPPPRFFDLVAHFGGAYSGRRPEFIRSELVACHEATLASGERAYRDLKTALLSCAVFGEAVGGFAFDVQFSLPESPSYRAWKDE